MNLEEGKRIVLALLKRKGKAKNSEILQALNGDEELFQLIREDLIFNDLAEDKKGVGLIYIASPSQQSSSSDIDDLKPFSTQSSKELEEENLPPPFEKKKKPNTEDDNESSDDSFFMRRKRRPLDLYDEEDDDEDIWGKKKKKSKTILDLEDDAFQLEEKANPNLIENTERRRRPLNAEYDFDTRDDIINKPISKLGEKPWELFQAPEQESNIVKINLAYDTNEIQLHPFAFRLQKDLSEKGYQVWINKKQIEGDEILIPLITPGSVKRPNGSNLNDLILARSNHFQILPLVVSPFPFPLNIYRLGWVNIEDWQNPILYQNVLNQVSISIEQHLEFLSPHAEVFNILNPLDFGVEASSYALDFTGREWLYEEFDNWVSQDDSRIFIVTGNSGSGKTAIISQLAIKHPLSGAYYFCRNNWSATLEASSFVTTIAAQLLTLLPDFKTALLQSSFYQMLRSSQSFYKITEIPIDTLLHSLLLQPLSQIKSDIPILLFIDDLHLAEQQIIHERNIIRLLKENISRFPTFVKFTFSCPKDSKIVESFSTYKPMICNLSRDENYTDVNQYLENNFSVFPLYDMLLDKEIEPQDMVKLIIRKSRGNFLHAKQLVAAILWKIAEVDKPETFPNNLYEIYHSYFKITFTNNDYDFMRQVLEVICAAQEPLSAYQLAEILHCEPSTIEDHLIKVIFFFPLRDGKYQCAHHTIYEWLTGRYDSNHPYLINLIDGHKRLLDYSLPQLNSQSPNEYTIFHIIHHLFVIKDYQAVINLLNNYDFIRIKIENGYFRNLLDDYWFVIKIFTSPSHSGAIKDTVIQWLKLLQAILKSLERSFSKNISQLANDLYGHSIAYVRFDSFGRLPQQLLSQIQDKNKQPWLRPILPTHVPPGGALINVLRGHQGKINTLVLTPDSKKIITCADDTTIRVWDAERGTQLFLFTKHTKKINALAVNNDNTLCVSASNDKYLHVWDLIQGKCLATLAGHTSYVNSVAIPPMGTYAVSGSNDNTIKIWDLSPPFTEAVPESTRLINTLYGHTDSVEKVLISADGRKIISSSNDKTIRVWNLASGELLLTIRGHKSIINILNITPSNRFILSSSIEDYALKIWDAEDGNLVSTIRGHTGPITALAISTDGKWIITGSADKTIKIWVIPPGLDYANKFQPIELFTLKGHHNYIRSLAVINNRKWLVSTAADKMIKIWHLETGKEIRTLQSDADGYQSIFVSLDNKRLITPALDNTIKIWDISYGVEVSLNKEIQINYEPAHTNDINTIVISHDSKLAVTASSDGCCKVWNLHLSNLPQKPTIDLETNLISELYSYINHASPVHSVTISVDRKRCISAGYGIHIWNLADGSNIRTFGQPEWIYAIALTPDGKWIISGSNEHTLKIWEYDSGKFLGSLGEPREAGSWITSIVVTPDNKKVISAGVDKTIKIWDLRSGREVTTLRSHQDQIHSLRLSLDGKLLFSASNDKTIKIWKTDQWIELATLSGHNSSVRSIAAARNMPYLISVSEDGTIIIWDIKNYAPLIKTTALEKFYSVDVTPNAEYIIAGGCSGRLHIYRPENILQLRT